MVNNNEGGVKLPSFILRGNQVIAEIKIVRSRPILFKDEMVRSILVGKKTQTRRIFHPKMMAKPCPYGTAGDTLWVRECFQKIDGEFIYRSTIPGGANNQMGIRWKPSILMPREACRLELKIKAICTEALQDISEVDAIAEGCKSRDAFKWLWHSINGVDSWKLNPRVWVIEFEKLEKLGG